MLPPKIDLTEHGDFSGGFDMDAMDIPIDMEFYDEENNMSTSDYEVLVWWESIFGKRRHPNIKRTLFPKLGYDIPNSPRIPWKVLSPFWSPFSKDSKIPWSSNMGEAHDDRGFNLFGRR